MFYLYLSLHTYSFLLSLLSVLFCSFPCCLCVSRVFFVFWCYIYLLKDLGENLRRKSYLLSFEKCSFFLSVSSFIRSSSLFHSSIPSISFVLPRPPPLPESPPPSSCSRSIHLLKSSLLKPVGPSAAAGAPFAGKCVAYGRRRFRNCRFESTPDRSFSSFLTC